jgi:Cytochrome c7 and related cytochrome c
VIGDVETRSPLCGNRQFHTLALPYDKTVSTLPRRAHHPVRTTASLGKVMGILRYRLLTAVLLIGLGLSSVVLAGRLRTYPLPGYQQGYEPVQPIAFSHRQHAGDLQISCLYCHYGAERSQHAGVPSADVCMTCHRFVTASQKEMIPEILEARKANRSPQPVISAELKKLYDALGLDSKLEKDPKITPQPVQWVRVHNLPAYTCFDHRAHVLAGVTCNRCHGPVETMERVRQVNDLSMGWCVNCHRETKVPGEDGKTLRPSIDCATCHH